MPRLDELPPDLRATLSLLVDRGKSYAQVAELLGIPEGAVRDRAHAALDALAGAPGEHVPPPPPPSPPAPSSPPRGARSGTPAGAHTISPGDEGRAVPAAGISSAASGPPVSRRGGALLLAGIAIVVIVAVVLLTSGGGGSHSGTGTSAGTGTPASTGASASTPSHTTSGPSSGSTGATGASASKTGSKVTVTNQLTLSPTDPTSKAIGIVEVLAEGSQRAFYLAAEHLAPSNGFSYVMWLYNSPSSAEAISRAPAVSSDGRLQGGALLPSNAGDYRQFLLTRETTEHPTHPGPTVLSGPFSLGG